MLVDSFCGAAGSCEPRGPVNSGWTCLEEEAVFCCPVLALYNLYVGLSPLPVRVTTRIITFLVGDPYKPSFPLLLGGGTTQL